MTSRTDLGLLLGIIVSILVLEAGGAIMVSSGAGIFEIVGYASLSLSVFSFPAILFLWKRKELSLLLLVNLTFISTVLAYAVARQQCAVYCIDSMVATQSGASEILSGKNPYRSSILPFLEKAGLSPAFYTPRVDGTIEAHFVYPALNFLLFVPFLALGLSDIRLVVLAFNALAVLGVYKASRKPVTSMEVLLLFIPVYLSYLAVTFTDVIWAYMLLVSSLVWYSHRKLSLVSVGLALAYKQLAWAAMPFVLIRLWREDTAIAGLYKVKRMLVNGMIPVTTFLAVNGPFLLDSPGDWWASVMQPLVPFGPVTVMGGWGLVYIAQALGWPLAPVFYSISSGIVALALTLVYYLNFSRLRHFTWALPLFPFLFYQRSFLYYYVFWLLPFAVDLLRSPSVSARLRPPSLRVRLPSFRPSHLSPKGIATIAILISASTGITLTGVHIANSTFHSVSDVIVLPSGSNYDIPAVTKLNVLITNKLPSEVTPRFFVLWNTLPYYWQISDGPESLLSRANATYVIISQDIVSAIPLGRDFIVLVYDAKSSQLVGLSNRLAAQGALPLIQNGNFSWWTLDLASARLFPYGWSLRFQGGPGDNQTVERIENAGTRGASLSIYQDGSLSSRDTSRMSISQTINFTDQLSFLARVPGTLSEGSLAGVRVSDSQRSIYYLLGGTAIPLSSVNNRTMIVPLDGMDWQNIVLDLGEDWTEQAWSVPERVTVEFFVQASSTTQGIYELWLARISGSSSSWVA